MMPKSPILAAAFAVLVLSSACAGTVVLPGTNGTSSTGGSGDTGGAGGTGGATSTAGDGGSAGSGGSVTSDPTTKPDCSAWLDGKGIATQTLHFVNQTQEPLYLPTLCDGKVSFSLSTASDPADFTAVYDTSCLQTCAMLQTEPPFACGVCEPTVIRLLPGETRDFVWDGTALEQLLMPPVCFFSSPSSGACPQIATAAPGTYTASATAFLDCQGSCSCDAQGTCTGMPSGASTPGTASFTFPGAGPVDVVF